MAEEKILTLNLLHFVGKKPGWKQKNYAIKMIKDALKKKTKGERIILNNKLNEKVWKNVHAKLKIKLTKDNKNVRAELVE